MAVIHNDTFTVGVNTALTSHTPTPTGTGYTEESDPSSLNFTVLAASGRTELDANGSNTHILISSQPNPTIPEYDIELTTVRAATVNSGRSLSIVARYADTDNLYGGFTRPASAADKKIYKKVAGVVTELASGDSDIADDDTYKFEIRDATKKLFHKGSEILSTTDNAITAAGKVGWTMGNIFVGGNDPNSGWAIDNYKVTTTASANPGKNSRKALSFMLQEDLL
jgi:hypothetical protein